MTARSPGEEASGTFSQVHRSDDWAKWAQRLWQVEWELFSHPRRFAAEALSVLRDVCRAEGTALMTCESGEWHVDVSVGQSISPPAERVAAACAEDQIRQSDGWWLIPVRWPVAAVLVIHHAQAPMSSSAAHELQRLWNHAVTLAQHAGQLHRQCQRWKTILDMVADWQSNRQTEVLLERMAEAATRMLECERASIFLWDRTRRMLVGRPALGVEGHELRLPDDRGVVGQVVHTGQPRRVNRGDDQSMIDRTVDQQLRFHTRSLLCVPLLGTDQKVLGAFEMINKREGMFTDEDEETLRELARHAAIAIENTQHIERLLQSRNEWANQAAQCVALLGEHPTMTALRETIRRVADTDLNALLLGENGTGKEVVCRTIHALSRRRHEPLVAVNCAALPESLLESELFGHEQGAFTDARESRPGKFEVAGYGTLFLDEIGELSLAGQAKLLRAIEEKVIERVGGVRPISVHARIVTATNRDLAALVRERRFREDLYYRLNVVTLQLPPLRDRGSDIVLLAEHFLRDFCAKAGRPLLQLTAAARQRLLEHSWPGNVRELRNLMERFAYLHGQDHIDAADLQPFLGSARSSPSASGHSLRESTRRFQTQLIQDRLQRAGGNISRAARSLGMHRANLFRKMRQLGIQIPQTQQPELSQDE